MPITQINCPQCRQPIQADVQQVFDLSTDPAAKNRLLSGQVNVARCPSCGFNGALSTPVVYHDASKELLLTFVPPELALPRDEQEKVIGSLIKQVVDALPAEERKGYLFNPQASLTYQGMLERILEEDGITKEMIDAQQKRMSLVQRLATITDDEALAMVVKEDEALIDKDFFGLLSQLIQVSAAQGDEQGAALLAGLQKKLMPLTEAGRELQKQSEEVEKVVANLRGAGKDLNRESLLEMVIAAESDLQVEAYVNMTRPVMDYEFFLALSGKIDAAEGDEKERLTVLREKLQEVIQSIDEQVAERINMARKNVDLLVGVKENLPQIIVQNLQAIDDYFLQALSMEMDEANKKQDTARLEKLKEIMNVVQDVLQAASIGPDGVLLEALMEMETPEERLEVMHENADKITPEFIEAVTGFMMKLENAESEEEKALREKVRAIYREALRFSMKSQMEK